MVAIARDTRPSAPRGPSAPTLPARTASTNPHSVALPPPGTTTATSLTAKIFAALGFVGLALLALLAALLLFSPARADTSARAGRNALALEARQRPLARGRRRGRAPGAHTSGPGGTGAPALFEREPTRAPLRGLGLPHAAVETAQQRSPEASGSGSQPIASGPLWIAEPRGRAPYETDSGCAWVPGTPAAA